MIEVFRTAKGWTWHMICDRGRVLAYSLEHWPEEMQAFIAAKAYRTSFWRVASQTDHRMAACI